MSEHTSGTALTRGLGCGFLRCEPGTARAPAASVWNLKFSRRPDYLTPLHPLRRVTMKPEVEIYDTTLRDGSQGEGVNFSVMDKLRIAEKLDAFGIHYIEGGWPGSNPKDIEFFAQARRRKFKRAKLAAFGATRRKGVAVQDDEQ